MLLLIPGLGVSYEILLPLIRLVEDSFPESRPMVACPDIDRLVVPQRIDEPIRQG